MSVKVALNAPEVYWKRWLEQHQGKRLNVLRVPSPNVMEFVVWKVDGALLTGTVDVFGRTTCQGAVALRHIVSIEVAE